MLTFRAFGLTVRSGRALPGLPPPQAGGAPDLCWEFLDDVPAPAADEQLLYPGDPEAPTFTWVWKRPDGSLRVLAAHDDEYLEFVIDAGGQHVRIAAGAETPLRDAVPYLLGTVMGFVLRRRGLCCLHGGAVDVGGRAVVLVGPSGTGKSSTVAALSDRGHRVLTDDIAVVEPAHGGYHVRSSYPSIRLREAYVAATPGAAEGVTRLWSGGDRPRPTRLVSDLSTGVGRFQPEPLPLQAVVTLGPRGACDTEPRSLRVPPVAGTLTLLANTHLGFVLSRSEREREWALLDQVARAVPVYRLIRPDSLGALPQICDLIEQTATA